MAAGPSAGTAGHRIPPPPQPPIDARRAAAFAGASWPVRSFGAAIEGAAAEAGRLPARLDRWSILAEPRHLPVATEGAFWIAPGEPVTIQGRAIPGGMLFVSPPQRSGVIRPWHSAHGSAYLVDARLKVHWHAPAAPDAQGFWRSYATLSPGGRAAYLGWIADGRRDPDASSVFPFLFVCGLEQRLLSGEPPAAERELLVAELVRLEGIYGRTYLCGQTLTALLRWVCWLEILARPAWLAAWTPDPALDGEDMSLPLRLATALKVAAGERLSFELALSTLLCVPAPQAGVPSRQAVARIRGAFVALMRQRFATAFPRDLKLRDRPSSGLVLAYRSPATGLVASGPALGRRLPDPFDLNWSRLARLCVQAMDDLAPYFRAVKPDRSGELTPEALAALPPELYAARHGDLRRIDDWLATLPDMARLATAELRAQCLGGVAPGQGSADAAGVRGLRAAATILAGLGYGLEPDPGLGGSPALPSGFVQVFRAGVIASGASIRAIPGSAFRVGCLALASLAALSEAGPHEARRDEAEAVILGLSLVPVERLRLRAHALGLSGAAPKPAALRRAAGMVAPAERPGAAALILELARSGRMAAPRQVAVLEVVHHALGVDRVLIYAALHQDIATSRGATGPAASRQGKPGAAGPLGLATKAPLVLDRVAIGRIREETRGVSELLAAVYADDAPMTTAAPALAAPDLSLPDAPAPDAPASGAGGMAGLPPGLDAAHATFVQALLASGEWPRAAYEAEARRHGLMPDGATETINDWAFDLFNEALIEDGALVEDGASMVVNVALLRALEGTA